MKNKFLIFSICVFSFLMTGCNGYRQTAHGIRAGVVKLEVVNDNVIRVCATDSRFYKPDNSVVDFNYPKEKFWKVESQSDGSVILETSKIRARLELVSGQVTFSDLQGNVYLKEKSRSFDSSIRQIWEMDDNEVFYGKGPAVVSTKDYCILWSSTAPVRWGDAREFVQLNELFRIYDEAGAQGGLSASYVAKNGDKFYRTEPFLFFEDRESNAELLPEFPLNGTSVIFDGSVEPYMSGQYGFRLHYSGYLDIYIEGKRILPELWQPCDNPSDRFFFCQMEKGKRTPVHIVWKPDGDNAFCSLLARTPIPKEEEGTISFWSSHGNQIEYYFSAGETIDEAVEAYRSILAKKNGNDSLKKEIVALRWEEMRSKISEAINQSLTDNPCWTLDLSNAGVEKRHIKALKGSLLPDGAPVDLREWHELLTRWYQFGVFCPEFHGLSLNDPSFPVQEFEKLRSRVMPYIRSVRIKAQEEGCPVLRPLVMDYGSDPQSSQIDDQYMLGQGLMVCPIVNQGVHVRNVYFPENEGGWYDINTGMLHNGGSSADVYLYPDRIPLFAPCGAIVPFLYNLYDSSGNTMEINVFSGKDGSFILHEDDSSSIAISYSESDSKLTFSRRIGTSGHESPLVMRIRRYTRYGVRTIIAEYSNDELTVNI